MSSKQKLRVSRNTPVIIIYLGYFGQLTLKRSLAVQFMAKPHDALE